MNVLILYENEIIPEKGGVQRVTFVLFEYLRKNIRAHRNNFSEKSRPNHLYSSGNTL